MNDQINRALLFMTGNFAGEVYTVDDEMLASLDILENAPSYYTRRLENVLLDGKNLDCHMYLLTNFRKELLAFEFLKEYTASKGKPYVPRYSIHIGAEVLKDIIIINASRNQRDDTSLKYYSEVKN